MTIVRSKNEIIEFLQKKIIDSKNGDL